MKNEERFLISSKKYKNGPPNFGNHLHFCRSTTFNWNIRKVNFAFDGVYAETSRVLYLAELKG